MPSKVSPPSVDTWLYEPDFVSEPDGLLETVRHEVAWTDQMRARNTASMGIPYNYAGASYPEVDWHPAVWELAEAVQRRLGFVPTNCLMNRYDTGDQTIGWHADDVTILAPGTGIAIVSLGATRTLQLRGGAAPDFNYTRVALAHGSLFVMSAALQGTHKHCIKRERGAGQRISLTFRRLTHAPAPVTRRRWSADSPSSTTATRSDS